MKHSVFFSAFLGIFASSILSAQAQTQQQSTDDSEYSEYYTSTEEEAAQQQSVSGPDAQEVPTPKPEAAQQGMEPGTTALNTLADRRVAAVSEPAEDTGKGIMGFELGVNWSSSHKLAIEPGGCFRRFGIYLLTGLDVNRGEWRSKTAEVALINPYDPTEGGVELPDWAEQLKYEGTSMLLDIGLAGRFYFLGQLIEKKPNLYLELGGGYRAAVIKLDFDYEANGPSGDSTDEAKEEGGKALEMYLKDVAEAEQQRQNGFWVSLGVGGEYVFEGGFGIAGEVGAFMFYNTEWEDKSPFGYNVDQDGDTTVQWVYLNALYKGNELYFDLYYSAALRYHF